MYTFRFRGCLLLRKRTFRHLHGHGQLPADRDAVRNHLADRRDAQNPASDRLHAPLDEIHGEPSVHPAEGLEHTSRLRVRWFHFDRSVDRRLPHDQYTAA